MRLTMLAAIISRVRQDAHFEHGHSLHVLVGVGKTAMREVVIAGLLDEALQVHLTAPIAVLVSQAGQRGFDRWAVLACWFVLRFGVEHALLEQWQHEGKALFALGLSPQDAPGLLGFTAPLPVSMRNGGCDQRDDFIRFPARQSRRGAPTGPPPWH